MTLASVLLKVTITLVLALAGVRLARHGRAAVRHLLLAASFAVLLLLPVASIVVPAIRVEVPIATTSAAVLSSIDPLTFDVGALPAGIALSADTARPAADRSTRRPSISAAMLLLALWVAGVALCLAPVVAGLTQTRALRRSGLPWRDGQAIADPLARDAGIRRRVDLLVHESARGPMTCGVFRPAIILPIAAQGWAPADVGRAIVHELEHVRRGDWLSQGIARVVCAWYWFHPLVWIAHRHLALEAERACDDAVLRRSEAIDYADQLVALAARLSIGRHHVALGMANRADLATRVGAVLDGRQPRGRAGAVWIGLASVAALLLVMTISPLRIVATAAQGTPAEQFDVVSIKPCPREPMPSTQPGARGAGPNHATTSPGRAHWDCVTVDQLIQTAYTGPDTRLLNSLTRQRPGDPQIVRNGPPWVYSDKFEIEAKAAGNADRQAMIGPMLRSLLEDRFSLKTHRATEEREMYQLTVAKGGLKIKPTAPTDCWEYDALKQTSPPPGSENQVPCGNLHMNWNGGNRTLTFTGQPMQSFTDGVLSGLVSDRFVINRTGLDGRYSFRLEFAPDDSTPGSLAGLAWSRREGAIPPTAPTIFKALEQLGLKLEATKAPAEYLVIDRIEKPRAGGAQ